MPAPRTILAQFILCTGVVIGAAVGGLWAYLLWPAIAADTVYRHAMSNLMLEFGGALGLWALLVWPFARIAEYIDPSLQKEPPSAPDEDAPATAAPRSHRARSKASRPAKPE
jgi:hypothetical protein